MYTNRHGKKRAEKKKHPCEFNAIQYKTLKLKFILYTCQNIEVKLSTRKFVLKVFFWSVNGDI